MGETTDNTSKINELRTVKASYITGSGSIVTRRDKSKSAEY